MMHIHIHTVISLALLLSACRSNSVKIDEESTDTSQENDTDQTDSDDTDTDDTDTEDVNADNDGDGFSQSEGDCDDENPDLNPEASEIPNDGIDQDCDGTDLVDLDEDGFSDQEDCDDENETVNPGAEEIPNDGVDQDCDGYDLIDQDEDGYTIPLDCDDEDPQINPDSEEIPNDGIDQDCDGTDLVDQDEDGFSEQEDCNDEDPTVNPAAEEVLNDGIDQDCDGVDLQDQDGDGFDNLSDCDDSAPTIYPGAPEFCDGVGNNCDEPSWDPAMPPADESDDDGDGYVECDYFDVTWTGDATVIGGLDCDDNDPSVYPDATETLGDGIDQNCDGIDPVDADGDGWSSDVDCDDSDAALNFDDADGDSYTSCEYETCLTLSMDDTYGDGWNGGHLHIDVNGVFAAEHSAAGYGSTESICYPGGSVVSLTYHADEWEEENSYTLTDHNGNLLFSDGPSPQTGTVFDYRMPGLPDCDDFDPDLNKDDVDQDGYSTCDGDCDDTNILYTPVDMDGDGYSNCDGDCDDSDSSISSADFDADGWSTCDSNVCFELELIDNWGDGWSGGYLSLFIEGVFQEQFAATGSGQTEQFCMIGGWEYELQYTADQWEQDNYYILRGPDGQELFSDGPYPEEGSVFSATAPSVVDCDDHNAGIYPGATEIPDDGWDQDCDGSDLIDGDGDGDYYDVDCDDSDPDLNTSDADGDGYSSCQGDCSDADGYLNLDDQDGDGWSTCDLDCDDNDPSLNLDDQDGDSYNTCSQEFCYTLDMQDTYGDGWNGGHLDVFVGGAQIGEFAGQGSSSSDTFCFQGGNDLELFYTAGNWEEENTYTLMDESGNILFSDGPNPTPGSVFSVSVAAEADCDDSDPSINPSSSEIPGDGIDQNCDGAD